MEASGLEYIALWSNLTVSYCALEQDVNVNSVTTGACTDYQWEYLVKNSII